MLKMIQLQNAATRKPTMHASLAELLENLKPGLLWVQRDGLVRYANADACARTGLAAGRKLYDPDLARALAATVGGQVPRTVNAAAAGGGPAPLACRVLPGLARDDAFVLIDAGPADGSSFDNLMQVIRSDLRDPLRQAAQAVMLAQQPDADRHALDALTDGVHDLLRALDKLVDLADLWGSGALRANDRIELWPLLQAVWAELEPVALQRQVKVRFRSHGEARELATLYGSEHWLRRMFLECLESAVAGSRPGTTLEIEHRQMGPRALLVFRGCSVFARRADDAGEPEPAAGKPAAAPRPGARDRIGFTLCQHIVALHGGQLREEEEDGLHDFLIDLPTGAPFHDDHTQLDIAQAQRYASDLAALMARARKPKHRTGEQPQ